MSYSIRPLTCLDVKSAVDIFRDSFCVEEYKEFNPIWRGRTKEESVGVFNDDGDLLGFILIFENQRCLKYIAVHPQYQKYGIGSMLLKHALKRAYMKGQSLNLIPANATVQGWYERQGFIVSSWMTTKDGKVWPVMNFHMYWTRRHAKNLKRLHDYIQNERAEADNSGKSLDCKWRLWSASCGKHAGGLTADGSAGAPKSVNDHQDVARSEQGGINAQGAGA
jgi:GNAT superfamily N-acetyltransferase